MSTEPEEFDEEIPLTPKQGYRRPQGTRREKLMRMEVGQSFFIAEASDAQSFRGTASTLNAIGMGKWAVRRWEDGWRCWRLEPEVELV